MMTKAERRERHATVKRKKCRPLAIKNMARATPAPSIHRDRRDEYANWRVKQ